MYFAMHMMGEPDIYFWQRLLKDGMSRRPGTCAVIRNFDMSLLEAYGRDANVDLCVKLGAVATPLPIMLCETGPPVDTNARMIDAHPRYEKLATEMLASY
jgi:L-alanine-DL-glutamate epimerase-like enolase superfamily enzyme